MSSEEIFFEIFSKGNKFFHSWSIPLFTAWKWWIISKEEHHVWNHFKSVFLWRKESNLNNHLLHCDMIYWTICWFSLNLEDLMVSSFLWVYWTFVLNLPTQPTKCWPDLIQSIIILIMENLSIDFTESPLWQKNSYLALVFAFSSIKEW